MNKLERLCLNKGILLVETESEYIESLTYQGGKAWVYKQTML